MAGNLVDVSCVLVDIVFLILEDIFKRIFGVYYIVIVSVYYVFRFIGRIRSVKDEEYIFGVYFFCFVGCILFVYFIVLLFVVAVYYI